MIAIRSAFLGGANTHYLRYARTKAAIRGTIMELVRRGVQRHHEHLRIGRRYANGLIGVEQLIHLSEAGGLILRSKIPVNILELFILFLEHTLISLIIVTPMAHFVF